MPSQMYVSSCDRRGERREGSPHRFKTYLISGEEFALEPRYIPIKRLGSGAYGTVCSARDQDMGDRRVAIKKVRNVFNDYSDAKRILREVRLLSHMNHPNIISLHNLFTNRGTNDKVDNLYLITDYMETDLRRVVRSDLQLSSDHIAFITYQILLATRHLHESGCYHRDLKPANILLNSNCTVKLCDFGLARSALDDSGDDDEGEMLTEYVVTRWYRAPEVIVSSRKYGFAIDVWSIGCILGEMFNREPLFQGTNYVDQLKVVLSAIGSPTQTELQRVTTPDALDFITKLDYTKRIPMKALVPNMPDVACDLLDRMLQFDPTKRVSVQDALQHPFFAKFHSASDVEWNTSLYDSSYDLQMKDIPSIQKLMDAEIELYHHDDTSYDSSIVRHVMMDGHRGNKVL